MSECENGACCTLSAPSGSAVFCANGISATPGGLQPGSVSLTTGSNNTGLVVTSNGGLCNALDDWKTVEQLKVGPDNNNTIASRRSHDYEELPYSNFKYGLICLSSFKVM